MQICRLFELLTRFIHKMTLLVAMFAVPGYVYMPECVFFLNVEVFGVNDSHGRIKKWSIVLDQIPLHKSKQKHFVVAALRELFRESAKMNLKSSQNCRGVKLAALGESGLESCTLKCCVLRRWESETLIKQIINQNGR